VDSSPTKVRKLLVLCGSGGLETDLHEALASLGHLHQVRSFDEALQALRTGPFDLVISQTADFLPLERSAVTQQAGMILETIGQGICILDTNGKLLWANAKMRSFSQEVRDGICTSCQNASFAHESPVPPSPSHIRARRFSLTTSANRYFEVTATPVVDAQGHIQQIAAVVWDATNARRLQRKLDAIDKAGRELVRLDSDQASQLTVPERLELLEQRIIKYTRDLMNFDNFAIRIINKETNKLELVSSTGLTEEGKSIDIYVNPEDNGISGYVAATGRSYICPDVSKDPRYIVGISDAQSSLTVPLRLHDQTIGVFNVESRKTNTFNEDDRQFAEIFGRYVAIALHILDLLVSERYTTKGQLAGDVTARIAAPLNDILTDAVTLMEDYIGHDDLRHRLQAISDNVAKIKQCLKQVAQPGERYLLNVPEHPLVDPILQGKTVLVADDETIIRQTISEILAGYGCLVETARDGAEAIAMIGQRKYDLVLSDIRMPQHNGYEIFAAAKAVSADCPVILMTGFGYDPHHSIIRANKEGLDAVLFKPFKVEHLITETRKALTPR
jgi:two-component system, sensor histidine kinase SagS